MAQKSVLFTDVLGFSALSSSPGAEGAQDALSAVARILSQSDAISKILNWAGWEERFALSDSIFMAAADPVDVSTAAADFFFALAYVTHSGQAPVLMRGGIAFGDVVCIPPIFPDSATANLVGDAVVRAVRLEGSPPKGPRLFVDEEVATALQASQSGVKWLLAREGDQWELLWLLPPDPLHVNGLLVGELCVKVLSVIMLNSSNPGTRHHYLGYLDLLIRSLMRLAELHGDSREMEQVLNLCRLHERVPELERLLMPPEFMAEQLRTLAHIKR